jgi:phosphomannomutase
MRTHQVLVGGEESGGLSVLGHIPEKDGLVANLLVMECLATEGKSLVELQEEIYNIASCKFYTDRIDLKTDKGTDIITKFKSLTKISDYEVSEIDLKDGVKLMLGENTKILVRPSGTEPLLRIYFETDSIEKLEELKSSVIKLVE